MAAARRPLPALIPKASQPRLRPMAQQGEARLRASLGVGRSKEREASQVVAVLAVAVQGVAVVVMMVTLQVVALGAQALALAASPRLRRHLAVASVAAAYAAFRDRYGGEAQDVGVPRGAVLRRQRSLVSARGVLE